MKQAVLFLLLAALASCSGRGPVTQDHDASDALARPPISLPVAHVRQESPNWCWLAVAQMVLSYKQWAPSPSQCRLLEIGYGYPQDYCCTWRGRCDRGGTLEEIGRIVQHFSGRQVYLGPAIEPDELYAMLARQNLVVARVVVPPGQGGPNAGPAGHTVLIRGMRWAEGTVQQNGQSFQAVVPMVLVNDPAQNRTVEATYAELARYWERSIIID